MLEKVCKRIYLTNKRSILTYKRIKKNYIFLYFFNKIFIFRQEI